jgi:hypothetical protein
MHELRLNAAPLQRNGRRDVEGAASNDFFDAEHG